VKKKFFCFCNILGSFMLNVFIFVYIFFRQGFKILKSNEKRCDLVTSTFSWKSFIRSSNLFLFPIDPAGWSGFGRAGCCVAPSCGPWDATAPWRPSSSASGSASQEQFFLTVGSGSGFFLEDLNTVRSNPLGLTTKGPGTPEHPDPQLLLYGYF